MIMSRRSISHLLRMKMRRRIPRGHADILLVLVDAANNPPSNPVRTNVWLQVWLMVVKSNVVYVQTTEHLRRRRGRASDAGVAAHAAE